MNQALQYYSLLLPILWVTYFLTLVTNDMRQIRKMMSALPLASLASCEFYYSMSKRSYRWIFMSNYLLFPYFIFSYFSNMVLSDALIIPILQLQTQQMMTSLIRLHIEYLLQTYHSPPVLVCNRN